MATADYVKALIRSHLEGDEERLYAIALPVGRSGTASKDCGIETFKGVRSRELRELVEFRKQRLIAVSLGPREERRRGGCMR